MNELDLLRRYAQENSQEAFAEIVRRHLGLVHSAALRQVRSPQLAEEVAQSVFLDLARSASRLKADTQLGAWLYAVTRRTAVDAIRRESRRQARERTAAELAADPAPPWVRVEDLLDEAMASLREGDRQAVLLRYFQGRSLREVGAALAISEDTAQKRISRAIGKLQGYFSKRGVAVASGVLAAGLSQHAVRAAPAALQAGILAGLSAQLTGPSAALAASKALGFGALQKAALAGSLLALGAGVVAGGIWLRRHGQWREERQRAADLRSEVQRLETENAAAAARLKAAEAEVDAQLAQSGSDAALEARIGQWVRRINLLKTALAQRPGWSIPQLKYLGDRDWLEIAAAGQLDTDAGLRQALATLRDRAQHRFSIEIWKAFSRYVLAHGESQPAGFQELAGYFGSALSPDLLNLYERATTSDLADKPTGPMFAMKAPADVEYDTWWRTGMTEATASSALSVDFQTAEQRYAAANHGEQTTDLATLQPYLRWPISVEALRAGLDRLRKEDP